MIKSDTVPAAAALLEEGGSAAPKAVKRGLRTLADEHARAQQAAALAERDHRRPAAMRALYLPGDPAERGTK
ncbi:MAG: hypothetical protein IPO58_22700 [Betaproteobacteria bacterium]|nr:hypothetical protein [Betaproteobacteria bacterium]MBK9609088.1 hypothetical protein [Betaproteobacteria bacterium]